MPNDNNDSIRYLMKEMDPSEEVLMERSMMEDEDLLIEVECMRQTLRKLDENLPMMDPPTHVTNEILEQASEQKPNTSSNLIPISLSGNRVGYMAAAAVVAVGLISGVLFYQDSGGGAESSQQSTTSASISSSPAVEVENSEATVEPETAGNAVSVDPWVDREEVLHFQDQFSEQGRAEFDSILQTTTQKLKPIDDPLNAHTNSRSVQLTGSEQ